MAVDAALVERITKEVRCQFATMGGGDTRGDSPVLKAMADTPPAFMTGVSVEAVVRFVLEQAMKQE